MTIQTVVGMVLIAVMSAECIVLAWLLFKAREHLMSARRQLQEANDVLTAAKKAADQAAAIEKLSATIIGFPRPRDWQRH